MDPYKALGVDKNATAQDIKAAWRKAQVTWHPDKHPGDKKIEDRFKRISSAYEILSDEKTRRAYDMTQATGLPSLDEVLDFNLSQEDIVKTFVSTINEVLEKKAPNYRDTIQDAFHRYNQNQNLKNKKKRGSKKRDVRVVKQGNVVFTIPKSK